MSTITKNNITKRVTLQDVANMCGVTKASASMALRGNKRISEATTARIVAAALELGYSPELNDAARRLSHLRNNTTVINHVVAAFLPTNFYSRTEGFLSEMFRGMIDVLEEKGYALLINYIRGDNNDLPSVFSRGDVDGAIVFSRGGSTINQIQTLRKNIGFNNRTIVSLLGELEGCALVNTDDYQATYEAVTHLLLLGHRYIIQCIYQAYNPEELPSPNERVKGAQQAIADFGLNPDKHLHLFEVDPLLTGAETLPTNLHLSNKAIPDAELTQHLLNFLNEHSQFTAIIAINDPTAIHLWHILHNADINVPDDISIIGFDDNFPMMDDDGENMLSSIHIPLQDIGREAARLVIQLVNGEAPAEEKRILQHELIIRKSLGSAKKK
jgi:DNA-binding LacI/PurR family transcriptional regulator